MAFTTQDRTDLRLYLGYAARYYQTINSALEQAINAVEGDATVVTAVQGLVVRCKDIDTKLAAADSRQKLEKAEEITFAGPKEIMALRSQGRQTVGRIASILGVPVKHDAFSASAGNLTSPWTFGGGSGSGVMKLG